MLLPGCLWALTRRHGHVCVWLVRRQLPTCCVEQLNSPSLSLFSVWILILCADLRFLRDLCFCFAGWILVGATEDSAWTHNSLNLFLPFTTNCFTLDNQFFFFSGTSEDTSDYKDWICPWKESDRNASHAAGDRNHLSCPAGIEPFPGVMSVHSFSCFVPCFFFWNLARMTEMWFTVYTHGFPLSPRNPPKE